MLAAETIEQWIVKGLPGAQVEVTGEDGRHFKVLVVWSEFAGKRSLDRHRLVYDALGDRMGREIHALSIQAFSSAHEREQAISS